MESLWASLNGLIFVGLLFAALPCIRMGNKTLAKQIYGNSIRFPKIGENEELTTEEKAYIKVRLKEILEDKVHYVTGFAMSAVGTFGTLWCDVKIPNTECERKLQLLLYTFFWIIVAFILKGIVMKYKEKKIIKGIVSGEINCINEESVVFKETQ